MKNPLHEKLRSHWKSGRRLVPQLLLITLLANAAHAARLINLESPNASIRATLSVRDNGRLMLTVFDDDQAVISPSPLGIVVDGADLGIGVELGREKEREIHEVMPRRGVKSMAVNHCMEYLIPVTVRETGFTWALEIRVSRAGGRRPPDQWRGHGVEIARGLDCLAAKQYIKLRRQLLPQHPENTA
jgi:alpha-glucosidase